MPLNLPGMEQQVRNAAMALLPSVANATLLRTLTALRNELGEPAIPPIRTIWPVRLFFLKYKQQSGFWSTGGVQTRAREVLLFATGGEAVQVSAWHRGQFWGRTYWGCQRGDLRPILGDQVDRDSVSHKIVELRRQDLGNREYWEIEVERL